MKKHSVDYIRICVEQRTGKLSDRQYSNAYSYSYKKECSNMQQRIDAIVKAYYLYPSMALVQKGD